MLLHSKRRLLCSKLLSQLQYACNLLRRKMQCTITATTPRPQTTATNTSAASAAAVHNHAIATGGQWVANGFVVVL